MTVKKLKTLLSFFTALLLTNYSFSQGDFVSSINERIEEVNSAKYVYKQNLELIGDEGKAKIKLLTIDSKGRKKAVEYAFNFKDLSEKALNYKVDRDVIKVGVFAADKNRFIAEFKDDELSGYTADFIIYSRDYDKAKEVIEAFTKLINYYEEVTPSNAPPSKFGPIQDWLITNIKGFEGEKNDVRQSLSFDPENTISSTFTTTSSNSKGDDVEFYTFNLADLDAEDISIEMKSNMFFLELTTKRGSKYISYNEDGELENNVNNVQMWSTDLELIKLWKEAFKKAIPLAEEILEKNQKVINTKAVAQNYIKMSQDISFDSNCNCTVNFKEKDVPMTYKFNFADLDDNSLDKSVSGYLYEVELKAKKGNDYIAIYEEDALIDFKEKVVLTSENIESFRQINESLKFLITQCEESYVISIKEGSLKERVSWIAESIPNIEVDETKIEQEITFSDDEPCEMRFDVKIDKSGKEESNGYELKAHLLDPDISGIEVNGNNVYVFLQAEHKGKVIEAFENGEPDNFVSTVKIQIDDLEKAKSILETFKTVMNDCK
ncbi:hypothetical protein [uncultured Arcticibacterium sp.]|uniref:hypothetical protein n=1 Tax=uncultured Arcticibacterium sp. TaxID=2173042 RepID=UPI0030F7CE76